MAATLPTYYDVLRVDRSATPDHIRRSYRKLAQRYHPDKMPGNANASRAMAAINTAYGVLSDAQQRAEHDRWIRQSESRPAPLRATVTPQSKWSAAWPWYLLFATMAFALLTIMCAAYFTLVPPRPVVSPAQYKEAVKAPAAPAMPSTPLRATSA